MQRKDALCPHCGSLELHCLLWLCLSRETDLFDGPPKMIHMAIEPCLEPRFKKWLGEKYLTADLFNPHAMVKIDITNIEYPDQSFDIIYCSHVLGHLQNGKKTIRKFPNVMKDNGWSILFISIYAEKTFDKPFKVEYAERLKAFGQEDHVRRYDPNYINILHEIGCSIELTKFIIFFQKAEAIRIGLIASGSIYYCSM